MGRRILCCKTMPPIPVITNTMSTELTFAFQQGPDGSRQPSEKEISLATEQGKAFYSALAKVNFN